MTLGDALRSDRSENLNALRLLLAMAVIMSHAWPLALGPGTLEPLEHLTGHSLGGWAVGVFFFISGMLITASAERKSMWRFWTARARRIIPGHSWSSGRASTGLWCVVLSQLRLGRSSQVEPVRGAVGPSVFKRSFLYIIISPMDTPHINPMTPSCCGSQQARHFPGRMRFRTEII